MVIVVVNVDYFGLQIILLLLLVLLSRYGKDCASNCKKGKTNYFWCWTAFHLNKLGDKGGDWDYCAPKGETSEGKRCMTACSQNGEDYW